MDAGVVGWVQINREKHAFQGRAKIAENTFQVKCLSLESPVNSGCCAAAIELGHEVVNLPSMFQSKITTCHSTQRGQRAPNTEVVAQISSQGADVCPFAAMDGHVDVQHGVTLHFRRLNDVNSEPIHCDGGGASLMAVPFLAAS